MALVELKQSQKSRCLLLSLPYKNFYYKAAFSEVRINGTFLFENKSIAFNILGN